MFAVSSLTVFPLFSFFHLAATLPLLAVVYAITLAYLLRLTEGPVRLIGTALTLLLSAYWIITAGPAYRPAVTPDPSRKVYEYSNLVPLAQEIRQTIGPGGRIYLFPDDESTANLYYLLESPPPRFWVFAYPWYMLDWIRARILNTLGSQPPDWVIYFPGHQEVESRAPDILAYLKAHYERKAIFQWELGEAWLLEKKSNY